MIVPFVYLLAQNIILAKKLIIMKAPVSKRIKNILLSKESSRELMERIITGERNGSQTLAFQGKKFSLIRVFDKKY